MNTKLKLLIPEVVHQSLDLADHCIGSQSRRDHRSAISSYCQHSGEDRIFLRKAWHAFMRTPVSDYEINRNNALGRSIMDVRCDAGDCEYRVGRMRHSVGEMHFDQFAVAAILRRAPMEETIIHRDTLPGITSQSFAAALFNRIKAKIDLADKHESRVALRQLIKGIVIETQPSSGACPLDCDRLLKGGALSFSNLLIRGVWEPENMVTINSVTRYTTDQADPCKIVVQRGKLITEADSYAMLVESPIAKGEVLVETRRWINASLVYDPDFLDFDRGKLIGRPG